MISTEAAADAQLKLAFRVMWELWPRMFADGEVARKKGMFLRALESVDPMVLVEAAEWCVSNKKWPPTPKEFSEIAWRIHRERHVHDPVSQLRSSDAEVVERALHVQSKQERLHKRAMYILKHCTSGKLSELSDIWALLLARCTTDQERMTVQDGTVTKDKIKEAITAHREGRKATTVGISAHV